MTAELTQAHDKQLQHTMENSTDSMSDLDYKSLVNHCLEICSALKDKGCKFSLSLRLGSVLNFSLSSEGCNPEATKRIRRSPSYLRRQIRRRAAFLERKKKLPLADEEHEDNSEEESNSDDSESKTGSDASEPVPETKQEEHEVAPTDDHWKVVPSFSSYPFDYHRRKREERRTLDHLGRPRVSIVDSYKRHIIRERRVHDGYPSVAEHCVFAPAYTARDDVERAVLTKDSTKLKEINGTYGKREFNSDGKFHLTGNEIFPHKEIRS